MKPIRRHPAIPLFKLFGVPLRVVIFQRLARHPQTASELARELPIGRPAVVQHLSALKAHGLVDARPDGRRRIYFICPEGLAPLAQWLSMHRP